MYSKIAEKSLDFSRFQIAWVPLVIEQDKLSNPLYIRFFSSVTIVVQSESIPDLVHEFLGHRNITLHVFRNISILTTRLFKDLHRSQHVILHKWRH